MATSHCPFCFPDICRCRLKKPVPQVWVDALYPNLFFSDTMVARILPGHENRTCKVVQLGPKKKEKTDMKIIITLVDPNVQPGVTVKKEAYIDLSALKNEVNITIDEPKAQTVVSMIDHDWKETVDRIQDFAKSITKDFAWATDYLKEGLCLRRSTWNPGTYIQTRKGSVIYYHDACESWPWSTRMEDLLATTWELL